MKLYRYSPIENKEQLFEAIRHIIIACHKLCKQSFGKYLPNAGNVGIFCHYENEYKTLTALRQELTEASDNFNQKYFRLHEPITVPAIDNVPATTYTYLYIRKPDPYRAQVGDLDFYLKPEDYVAIKNDLQNNKSIKGARIFSRPELDMIELYDPDVDVLAYVSTHKMTENVRAHQ